MFTAQIDAWWPPSHRRGGASTTFALEAREGGRFYQRLADGVEVELGEVLRWEPPGRLTYTWHPGSDVGPTQVDVRFVADDDATRVEVVHSIADSGLGDAWPSRAKIFDASWDTVLAAFAAHVA